MISINSEGLEEEDRVKVEDDDGWPWLYFHQQLMRKYPLVQHNERLSPTHRIHVYYRVTFNRKIANGFGG